MTKEKEGDAIALFAEKMQQKGRAKRIVTEVWRFYGKDYDAEKEKQRALWDALQEKAEGGEKVNRKRRLRFMADLKDIASLDTQEERAEAVKNLQKLAELAHNYATRKRMKLNIRLKWTRVEAYIYQTINTLMTSYDKFDVKKAIQELEKRIDNALGKGP